MSTKTSIKRVALVAVSALGFGLLSVMPAKAALTSTATTATDVVYGTVGSQVLAAVNVDAGGTASAGATIVLTPTIVSKPAGSQVTVATYAAGTNTLSMTLDGIASPVVSAGTSATTDAVAAIGASNGVETITAEAASDLTGNPQVGSLSLVADVPGVYKALITTSTGTDTTTNSTDNVYFVIRPASNSVPSTTGTLSAQWSCAVVTTAYGCSDGSDNQTLSVTMPAGITNVSGNIKLQVTRTADTTDLPLRSVIDDDFGTSASIVDYTAGTSTTTFRISVATPTLSAGLYEFLAFEDVNNSGTWDSSERFVTTSLRIADEADYFSVTLSPSTVVAGDTVRISVKYYDADDYQTVKPAADTLAWTLPTGVTGTTGLTGDQNQSVAQTGEYVRFAVIGAASATTAGANDIVFDPSATGWDDVTKTLTIREPSDGTYLSYVDASGIKVSSTLDTTLETSDATGTLSVDTANTSVYFTATGTAGTQVSVTVTPGSTTATSRVSGNGTTLKTILADGTVTFPVTVTTPLSTDSYTITLEAGATDLTYTVNYDQPGAAWTILPGAAFTVKTGTTNTITAVLKDVFGRALTSKAVTAVVGSRNPLTFSGTTDAAGIFTVTIPDTSTSTTVLTDTLTLTYSYLDEDAAAATATGGSATITYSSTGLVASTITVTPAATSDKTIDQVEEVAGAPVGSTLVYTVTAKSSTGANTTTAGLVTFTGGADDKFLNGVNTCVLSASTGQCTVTVYRQKTGYASITATGGGVSGTAAPVKWVNAASEARNIALSVSPASLQSESTGTVKATVTDRWANPVAAVTVTFSESGAGRISATSCSTGADGSCQVDFTSNAGETGSNTIAASFSATTQSANLAGYVNGTRISGVTAGNNSTTAAVTVTASTAVSTADALLELAKAIGTGKEVEAAADAAAEAIDAANAATDAANLAAEAADAATVAAEEARDAADAATAAVEELATQVATLMSALKAQLTTLANTVAKIAKKVKA